MDGYLVSRLCIGKGSKLTFSQISGNSTEVVTRTEETFPSHISEQFSLLNYHHHHHQPTTGSFFLSFLPSLHHTT